MSNLGGDTILQRTGDLRIHIDSSDDVWIDHEGLRLAGGVHGLAVLEAFARPRRVAEACAELQARARGARDWMDLMTTIVELHQAGVLRQARDGGDARPLDAAGAEVPLHIALLNDRTRTQAYLAAVAAVVRPGDVVVDIGTGTGVLALAAARAGARQVYAVEAGGIAQRARDLFEANGLADRITLVSGWSTRIALPERGDVLVSEIIGNEPLDERVLESVADARQRLLRPGARMVPGRLRLFGLPVALPPSRKRRHVFTEATLRTWQAWYGIDFSPLRTRPYTAPRRFFVRPQQARDWPTLGEPALIADLDLTTCAPPTEFEHSVRLTAPRSGTIDAVLIYRELELAAGQVLTTRPADVAEDNHWRVPVWLLPESLALPAGATLQVTYRYRGGVAQVECGML